MCVNAYSATAKGTYCTWAYCCCNSIPENSTAFQLHHLLLNCDCDWVWYVRLTYLRAYRCDPLLDVPPSYILAHTCRWRSRVCLGRVDYKCHRYCTHWYLSSQLKGRILSMREWELVSACVFITYCKVHNRSENVHMYTQYCVHVHIKWCLFVTAEDCNKFLNVN